MSDASQDRIKECVQSWLNRRNAWLADGILADSPLYAGPALNQGRRAREFAAIMDAETRKLIAALPDFNPVEWEAFLELLPHARYVLGIDQS